VTAPATAPATSGLTSPEISSISSSLKGVAPSCENQGTAGSRTGKGELARALRESDRTISQLTVNVAKVFFGIGCGPLSAPPWHGRTCIVLGWAGGNKFRKEPFARENLRQRRGAGGENLARTPSCAPGGLWHRASKFCRDSSETRREEE